MKKVSFVLIVLVAALSQTALGALPAFAATDQEVVNNIAPQVTVVANQIASITSTTSIAVRNQILADAAQKLKDFTLQIAGQMVSDIASQVASITPTTSVSLRSQILSDASQKLKNLMSQILQMIAGGAGVVLARGDHGGQVSALQNTLRQTPAIYPEGLMTGFFGPLTEAAVMRFQARYGITPTGVLDRATLALMISVYCSGGSQTCPSL